MRVKGYTHFNNEYDSDNLINTLNEELTPDIGEMGTSFLKQVIYAIISIESIALVIKEIFPNESKISAFRDIFASKDLKIYSYLSEEKRKMLTSLHILFPEMRSRKVLEKNIKMYQDIKYGKKHVSFDISDIGLIENGCFDWVKFQVKNRTDKYKEYLLKPINLSNYSLSYPKENSEIMITDSERREIYKFDLSNREYDFIKKPNPNFTPLSIEYTNKDRICIPKTELIKTARDMDFLEKNLNLHEKRRMDWERRLKDVLFTIPNMNGFRTVESIDISGVEHWIGKLSVGKSTIIDIISFHLAQMDKKSVLVLNSVTDVLKKVDYFNTLGINAIPVLSYKNREQHVKDYISSLNEDENPYNNKSFYYLNTTCILRGIDRESKTEYIDMSGNPCYKIQIPKKKRSSNNRNNEISVSSNYKTCPYITKCSYYNVFRDLDKARIYITTPQSLVRVIIPKPFSFKRISMLEYLIRRADLFLVDEADRVQDTLDNAFISDITLLDRTGGYINKIIANTQSHLPYLGQVLYDEIVVSWINDLHLVSILLNRIGSFLSNIKNKQIANEIKEKPNFSGFGLWLDIASRMSKQIERNNVEDSIGEEAKAVHEILVNYFEEFRQAFMDDDYSNLESKELCEIAANVTNEDKMKKDIERFVNNEIISIIDRELKKLNIKRNKNTIIIEQDMDKWIYFIMTVSLLEIKLRHITESMPTIVNLIPNVFPEDDILSNNIYREFDGIIPSLPISIHYGFQYIESPDGYPILKLLNYSGVGRYILYKLSELYKVLDEKNGAHCVLLSGTSCAPYSPKYNINLPVKYLLKSASERIPEIQYKFLSTFSEKISGISNDKLKKINYQSVVKKITEKDTTFGTNISQLERILNELEEERKRLLIVVGSYRDAEIVSEMINNYSKESGSIVRSLALKRNLNCSEASRNYLLRQQITRFVDKDECVLVAPLMAMERGHNILVDMLMYDDEKESKVAAFGAAIFLTRPYYLPYDFKLLINRLNDKYINLILDNNSININNESLLDLVTQLKEKLYEVIRESKNIAFGYRAIDESDRNKLLADTFVNTFQLEGRLIRGNVNAKIYFADSSFAPNTSKGTADDTIETSMLLGWKYIWNNILNNPSDSNEKVLRTVLKELYSIRLEGLQKINVAERKELNYE